MYPADVLTIKDKKRLKNASLKWMLVCFWKSARQSNIYIFYKIAIFIKMKNCLKPNGQCIILLFTTCFEPLKRSSSSNETQWNDNLQARCKKGFCAYNLFRKSLVC